LKTLDEEAKEELDPNRADSELGNEEPNKKGTLGEIGEPTGRCWPRAVTCALEVLNNAEGSAGKKVGALKNAFGRIEDADAVELNSDDGDDDNTNDDDAAATGSSRMS